MTNKISLSNLKKVIKQIKKLGSLFIKITMAAYEYIAVQRLVVSLCHKTLEFIHKTEKSSHQKLSELTLRTPNNQKTSLSTSIALVFHKVI